MRKQDLGGILIVAYYFPPTKAIGTLRNYSVAQELDKYFECVHVLSTSNADFLPTQTLPTSPTINLHKAKTFDFRSFIYWFNGKSENLQKKNPPGKFTKRLLKLKNSFPSTFRRAIGRKSLMLPWDGEEVFGMYTSFAHRQWSGIEFWEWHD